MQRGSVTYAVAGAVSVAIDFFGALLTGVALFAAFAGEALTVAFLTTVFFAAAFFAAQRFLRAFTIFALPSSLSLRFGFFTSAATGAAGCDSPRIFAHLRC